MLSNGFVGDYRKKTRIKLISLSIKNTYNSKGNQLCKNEGEDSFLMQDITNIIVSLDSIYRIPFVMRYKGYSYKEISDHLDIPISTVRSRVFTSRTYLRNQINEK